MPDNFKKQAILLVRLAVLYLKTISMPGDISPSGYIETRNDEKTGINIPGAQEPGFRSLIIHLPESASGYRESSPGVLACRRVNHFRIA